MQAGLVCLFGVRVCVCYHAISLQVSFHASGHISVCTVYMRAHRHMCTVITLASGPVDSVPASRGTAEGSRAALNPLL